MTRRLLWSFLLTAYRRRSPFFTLLNVRGAPPGLPTVIDGKAVTDTLSIMTYENSSNSNSESDDDYKHHSSAYDFGWNIGHATRDAVIAITAIVFVFGFPLIIVFIIFFFRKLPGNQNR